MMVTTGLDRQLAAAGWIADGVNRARMDEALARATAFRTRFGGPIPDREIDDEPARALAREIAEASITHVGPALPKPDGQVRVVYFQPKLASPVEELAHPAAIFEAELRSHFGARLRFSTDAPPDGDGTLVVCSTNATFQPEQASRVRALLRDAGVLCAMRSPYDAALVPDRPALLSYGDVPVSLAALAAVLAGKRRPRGRLPVKLRGR
jgi:beta-N-acetylhexosaminidase